MTREEAQQLKTFKHHCNCGGYAWTINGRPEAQPHMAWCPQHAEYAEWYRALHEPHPPCGECHLQPGERCDICGAIEPRSNRNG